jgi:putative hydrolase of the HAD superfamily
MVKAVLFDYGGVLAEEGFREGLLVIGSKNGVDPALFFSIADALIDRTGYLTGLSEEDVYWDALRKQTGIHGSDQELREEILRRFVLRPAMISAIDRLRQQGLTVALLSDQTNWLDELERTTPLFFHFDRVFNSFRTHKSKRDASVFQDVCRSLGTRPEETLFIDDNLGHIRRAEERGLKTIHFTGIDDFLKQINTFLLSPLPGTGTPENEKYEKD